MNFQRLSKYEGSDDSQDKYPNAPYEEQQVISIRNCRSLRKPIRRNKLVILLPQLYKSKAKKKIQEDLKSVAKDIVNQLIFQMNFAYKRDKHHMKKKKLANNKILYLPKLRLQLKKTAIAQQFVQMNGLAHLQRWLKGLTNGAEPCYTVVKGVLEILSSLDVNDQQLSRVYLLQKIVHYYKKSDTKEIRQLSQSIINKWNNKSQKKEQS